MTDLQQTNLVIQTDDGVELVGDLYIPQGRPPFPGILQLTPHRARTVSHLGEIYAARGYLFLAVDARGRYRSGGQWEPRIHDRRDGRKLIEWLARHPLCNGRVASRGHAYCGYSQLLMAIDAPSALQAMVVCCGPGDPFVSSPFIGGAFDLTELLWLVDNCDRVSQEEPEPEYFGIKRFGTEETQENPYDSDSDSAEETENEASVSSQEESTITALSQRPFADTDLHLGVRCGTFREWVRHWRWDDYWRARSVSERLSEIRTPVLFITGWWDSHSLGTSRFFQGLREQQTKTPDLRLLIGPWDGSLHAPDCRDLPDPEVQLIERAAGRDELNDEFSWLDKHLQDLPAGPSSAAPVSLYLTGLHRWIECDDWPPPASRPQRFYLSVTEGGEQLLSTTAPSTHAAPSSYRFDPVDPTPFAPEVFGMQHAPFDNAKLAEARDDLLAFETAPLAEPIALVGEASAQLHVASDSPDFDLCVKLLDRYPDGRAIYLTDGILRARFRAGWDRPAPIEPGAIQTYQIPFRPLGHLLRPGHALRLEIASGAFPRFDINPCSGEDLAEGTNIRPARLSLHHSLAHPSQLLLPRCDDPRFSDSGPADDA